MRLLIDANILLDVLQNRTPHAAESSRIWKLCETGRVDGFVPALSFANLVYIMRKELDPERILFTIRALSLIFTFADLRQADLEKAAAMCWDDFEDAIQCVIAERIGADYIITSNTADYLQSTVDAVTPAAFLDLYSSL